MIHNTIKVFGDEFHSKPPKKKYATNKTGVCHIDDFCCSDVLDLKDYGAENIRGYRCVFVVTDNFSKFGWTVPLKMKFAQTKKESFGNILNSSKRRPNLIESDDGTEFVNKTFTNILNNNKIKR